MLRRWVIWIAVLALVGCQGAPTEPTDESTRASAVPSPARTFSARDVHRAEGAGQWYPADSQKLRQAVETHVSQAQVDPLPGRLVAVVVPHAGYVYSGGVAGYAFRALQQAGCADHTLIVLGDTHSGLSGTEIAIWAKGAFETPLGTILVDEQVAQAVLAADDRFAYDRGAFQDEHPVENQLPFIQAVCPGAQIVPVVINQSSLEGTRLLADALVAAARTSDRPLLIVASTDLSHYYSYAQARQIDEIALQAIVSMDPQAIIDSPHRCIEQGIADVSQTMCSMGTVLTAVMAARQLGADHATVLHYANSGDVPLGEREQVVGYGAVAFWQARQEESSPGPDTFALTPLLAPPADPILLSPAAQQELLALVQDTIAQFLASETFPAFRTDDPALLQPLGAYVTYERDGDLRGCLGRLTGDRSLYLNVQYAAVASALNDPRFPPVTLEEVGELTVEISVIHPMHPVDSPSEIDIGHHGVMMRVGDKYGALFLPQVPVEQGWDLEATLLNLCRKAGLPDDAWQRSDARFYVFGGQWFGEGQ